MTEVKTIQQKQQIELSVSSGSATIACKGDINNVSISGQKGKVRVDHEISLTHDGMTKLAISFLTEPAINRLFPHTTLPDGVGMVAGKVAYDKQADILHEYRHAYREEYGMPDQYGRSNIVGPMKREPELEINWGETVTLKSEVADGEHLYVLKTEGPVSLHLITDIMIAFARDNLTKNNIPQYAATYLRRWGEEAFENGRLKSDIPEQLKKGIFLKPQEEEVAAPSYMNLSNESLAPALQTAASKDSLSVSLEQALLFQQMEKQLDEKSAEIESLQTAANTKDEEIRNLSENIQELTAKLLVPQTNPLPVSESVQADPAKIEQIKRLQDELGNLSMKLTEAESALSAASKETSEATKSKDVEIAQLKQELSRKEGELGGMRETIKSNVAISQREHAKEIDELSSEIRTQANAIQTLENSLKERTRLHNEKTRVVESLETELEQTKRAISERPLLPEGTRILSEEDETRQQNRLEELTAIEQRIQTGRQKLQAEMDAARVTLGLIAEEKAALQAREEQLNNLEAQLDKEQTEITEALIAMEDTHKVNQQKLMASQRHVEAVREKIAKMLARDVIGASK